MKPKNEKGQFIKAEWAPEDVAILVELYPDTLTSEIANILGVGLFRVRNKAHNLGLKKSKGFISMTGKMSSNHPNAIASRFKQGLIPENKGKKQTEFMSPEAIERTKATRFKKGDIPRNIKQTGYERIDSKDGYIYIKTEDGFKLKHRVVWEQHHGTIPPGHNIQFKDGNILNCTIENLYMISRSEQLRQENSMYARYPIDVQLAIKAKGALNRQINKLTKHENHE